MDNVLDSQEYIDGPRTLRSGSQMSLASYQ